MLNREGWLDVSVNFVPLIIISVFVVTLLLYNPWGWEDLLVIAVTVGLHLVPILTLAPVSYLLVKVYVESDEHGSSETAARIVRLFSLEGPNAGEKHDARVENGE